MNKRMIKGYLFIIASAVIYGVMPVAAKFLYNDGINAMTLVFLRQLLSAPFLALIVTLQKQSLREPAKDIAKVSAIGLFGCCFTPVLLYISYNYLSAGTATIFHYVYPIAVALGGFIFLKKKPNLGPIFCILLCTVGIVLSFDPNEKLNVAGVLIALSSGITYATYIILLSSYKGPRYSGFKFNFYVAVAAAAFSGIVCAITMPFVSAGSSFGFSFPHSIFGWLGTVAFALVINIGAVVLFQQGTMIIGGERASVLSTLEPITSVFLDIVLFLIPAFTEMGKLPTVRTAIGSALVIAAGILLTVLDMKKAKK